MLFTIRPCVRSAAIAAACLVAGAGLASDPVAPGLRVATYNITGYGGSPALDADIASVFYGVFQGRTMRPDIVMVQEFSGPDALNHFVGVLNQAHLDATGEAGDWAAATFIGGSTGGGLPAVAYRTTRVSEVSAIRVATGSTGANPRPVGRYDFRPVGAGGGEGALLSLYPVHMKAGTSSSDVNRRRIEAEIIRNNAATIAARAYIVGGDLNIRSFTEDAHEVLIADGPGGVNDPISEVGPWTNNSTYRFVHTQDPATQMDDRYDQLLVSDALVDGGGFEYIGSYPTPFSRSTWNDPNHSYRTWGNDGGSYNAVLRTTSNQMVGASIAQAIIRLAGGGGHVPVFLDLRLPGLLAASTFEVDLGEVSRGAPASASVMIGNGADLSVWGVGGVSDLSYAITPGPGVTVSPATGADAPGGGMNAHTVSVSTDAAGVVDSVFTVTSDAATGQQLTVRVLASVIDTCRVDENRDGRLDVFDILRFFGYLESGRLDLFDVNGDFRADIFDIIAWFELFGEGC